MSKTDAHMPSGEAGAQMPSGTAGTRMPSGVVGARIATPQSSLWTPAELGDDLALWLDAQDESTLTKSDVDSDEADEVEVWGDKSGNGNDASQVAETERAEYDSDGINGYSALYFDGVDDSFAIPVGVSPPFTLFVLGLSDTVSSNSRQRWLADEEKNRLLSPWDGKYRQYTGPFAPDGQSVSGTGAGLTSIGTSSETTFRSQGTKIGTSPAGDWPNMRIGPDPDLDSMAGTPEQIDGWLGVVVVVDGSISLSQVEKIEGWGFHHYDLSDKLRSSHPYKDSPPTV